MNNIIEQSFIKTFIDKNMQDRFIFELSNSNPRKRVKAISRFAQRDKYLKNQYIHLANKALTVDDVEKEIKKFQISVKDCYIIGGLHDGETMSIKKALEASFDYLGVSVIVVDENIAFIKTETCIGAPMKYILHKKQNLNYKKT